MKLKDINLWENEQKPENENKYIPGSSEKKRACMMYLFFGIMVSLSKKEFSPFEFYHLKQSIWLWILILPIVLISFVPVLRWISIIVLVVLLAILGRSFANAFNWKYFDNSKNIALTLPAGIWGWFLDLFELWIKSTWEEEIKSPSDTIPEIEKDIANDSKEIVSDSEEVVSDEIQTTETSLEEDVEAMEQKEESKNDENA